MNEMDKFRTKIRGELYLLDSKQIDIKQKTFFVWLCAVRVFPFWGMLNFNREDILKPTYALLDAIDTVGYTAVSSSFLCTIPRGSYTANDVVVYAQNAVKQANLNANTLHDNACNTDTYDKVIAADVYVKYAKAAYHTAEAIAKAVDTAYSAANETIIDVACDVAYAAKLLEIDLRRIIIDDLMHIKSNIYDKFSNNIINIYGEIWYKFQDELEKVNLGDYCYHYSKIFKNGFQSAKEILECYLNGSKQILNK